jgi:hypothetical protein
MKMTTELLDKLGFSEYWAGCGDFGERSLDLGGKAGDERLLSKKEYPLYYIIDIDEETCGPYGEVYKREYQFANKHWVKIDTLHDMVEDIKSRRTPEEVEKFFEILREKDLLKEIMAG